VKKKKHLPDYDVRVLLGTYFGDDPFPFSSLKVLNLGNLTTNINTFSPPPPLSNYSCQDLSKSFFSTTLVTQGPKKGLTGVGGDYVGRTIFFLDTFTS